MRVYEDIPYVKDGHPCHLIDLYLPDGDCSVLFLFFHGGGFVEGTRKNDVAMPEFTKDMTDMGIGVASAEYRLYPEARFPDFIEDAAEAVKFVTESISEYVSYDKLVVGGSSAGAYITQTLCFNDKYLKAVGVDPKRIDAYVHDAGQPTVHFNVLKERGVDPRRIIVDDDAPLYHVGKAESYPPMLFIISDNDIENRLEETELLLGAIRRFGYDMSKVRLSKTCGNHVWYTKSVDNGKSVYANLIIPFIKDISKP